MSNKKLCKKGESINKEDKKLKYSCKKCGLQAQKEDWCCKPEKIKKSA
jgi:lipopolysaccharide biosynthesis regulator YciM